MKETSKKQKIKAILKKKKERPVKCRIFYVEGSGKKTEESITDFFKDGKKFVQAMQSTSLPSTYITIFYRDKE